MSHPRTIWLTSPAARERLARLAYSAPDGYIGRVAEPTRTDAQNRLLWPCIAELRKQLPDMRAFTAEQTKLRFMDALGCELTFLPKLEGAGMFPVGQRSSQLTVNQFTGLIDLIHAYGARHNVRFKGE